MDQWEFCCRILNVPNHPSLPQIKSAYRQLAHLLHPDKHQNNEIARKKFEQLNEAYDYLIKHHGTPRTRPQSATTATERRSAPASTVPSGRYQIKTTTIAGLTIMCAWFSLFLYLATRTAAHSGGPVFSSVHLIATTLVLHILSFGIIATIAYFILQSKSPWFVSALAFLAIQPIFIILVNSGDSLFHDLEKMSVNSIARACSSEVTSECEAVLQSEKKISTAVTIVVS